MRVAARSTASSFGRGTRSRQRPSVRWGANGRSSASNPASRAARSHARCSSRTAGGSSTPSHSTRGAPRSGNVPRPARRASNGGTRGGGRREPRLQGLELLLRARAEKAQRQVNALGPHQAQPRDGLEAVLQRGDRLRAARASSSSATKARMRSSAVKAAAGRAGRGAASRARPGSTAAAPARGRPGTGSCAPGSRPHRRSPRRRGRRASRACRRPGRRCR